LAELAFDVGRFIGHAITMAAKIAPRPEEADGAPSARGWSQRGGDRLDLGVVVEHLLTHLTSPAGLLIPAERQRRVEHVVAVDPHRPGPDPAGELVGGTAVAGPHTGRETVDRVVGLLGDPVEIVVLERAQTTGPKISSVMIFMSGLVFSNTVGATK
jgi:hypothetical protein